MKEFVFGTVAQFLALDKELSKGKKYKFANRELPSCCSPRSACLWFAKVESTYFLYIDQGITFAANHPEFEKLLSNGVARFNCMNELASFFWSLQHLFHSSENSSLLVDTRADDATLAPTDETDAKTNAIPLATIDAGADTVVNRQEVKDALAYKTKPHMVWPEDLSAPLKGKIFGQDSAIDALADKVIINQMRKTPRLLTLALLGPTATGKSETAKSLSEIMSEVYGIKYGYIEIAGSEFIGEHTVHRFFGAPPGYVGHGQATILEPVRKNPHHIIVMNEIEKADEKILVGLMEAIDTGRLGMADNSKPIDLNQCILLFTSNIPINIDEYDACSAFEQAEMCRDAFTKHCGRPEISGKIGNFLVFRPLDIDAIISIVTKFIREELDSYDLKLAYIDKTLMADFLRHQTKYGARGIKGLVSDSVGRHLLRTHQFEKNKGKSVKMYGALDNISFEIE